MRFPFFSKDFRGSAKRKTLAFFGVSPAFFKKSKGLEGQGSGEVRGNSGKSRDFLEALGMSDPPPRETPDLSPSQTCIFQEFIPTLSVRQEKGT